MPERPSDRVPDGHLATAISNRLVRMMSDFTGRGPTQARTYLQDDLVTVLLRDAMTRGEQRLVADGRSAVVMAIRREFQDAMRDAFVAAIEELTGRHVLAFFSAVNLDPDAAVESFLLAPETDGDETSGISPPGAH